MTNPGLARAHSEALNIATFVSLVAMGWMTLNRSTILRHHQCTTPNDMEIMEGVPNLNYADPSLGRPMWVCIQPQQPQGKAFKTTISLSRVLFFESAPRYNDPSSLK